MDTQDIILHTSRLILRPFTLADVVQVTKLCNNYNIYKYTLSMPYPYYDEHFISWIESHDYNHANDIAYHLAMSDKDTNEVYGSVGLTHHQHHKHGEVAYWVGEPYWGNGYATEAVQAMIQFAFKEKQFHKVYAMHFASNPASGKVMLKAGMVKEGVLSQHVIKEDKYEDLVQYGIINNI